MHRNWKDRFDSGNARSPKTKTRRGTRATSASSGDERKARELLAEKVHMRDFERRVTENHLRRLHDRRPESLETSGLHLDIARDLKRIASHFVSVAYPILEEKGVLLRTRVVD